MTQFTTELLNFLFIISNSQLSEKYEFFGKFFLTLYFKDGSLFLSIIYCKYEKVQR